MYLWRVCNSHLICVCVRAHWYRYMYTLPLSKLQVSLLYCLLL